MAKVSSVIKSSLSGIKTKNIVEIPFTDTQLEIDAVFNCELPPQRMVTDALRASTTTKGGKDRTDPMTFARKIFVPCVMSWSFEEDCTVEAKMDFCGDDAIHRFQRRSAVCHELGDIAGYVALANSLERLHHLLFPPLPMYMR